MSNNSKVVPYISDSHNVSNSNSSDCDDNGVVIQSTLWFKLTPANEIIMIFPRREPHTKINFYYYSIDKTPSLYNLAQQVSSRRAPGTENPDNYFVPLQHGIIALKCQPIFSQIKILNHIDLNLETFSYHNYKYKAARSLRLDHIDLIPSIFYRTFMQHCFTTNCVICSQTCCYDYEIDECLCTNCVINTYNPHPQPQPLFATS